MKKISGAFPQGQISLVMLGQTMYYAKSSHGLGHRLAQGLSNIFRRHPRPAGFAGQAGRR
ncbi:MAG: hypothetical protein AAB445_02960 [Patescibacteria group bacterium]